MFVVVVESGVRFPDDSLEDVQKQKQLLKDSAAFLVSCQIPSLVSDAYEIMKRVCFELGF